jgi:hypothetical protein
MPKQTAIRQFDRPGEQIASPAIFNKQTLPILAVAAPFALFFGWEWLIASGAATLLIAALPCLVMCGLGLCMHRFAGRACDRSGKAPDADAE